MKTKRLVTVSLMAFVCVIGMAEILARSVLGLGTPPLSMYDPNVEYRFRPNQDVMRFGNRQLYNQYSMRSPELPDPSEREIVLTMGDSVPNGGSLTDHAELATTIATEQDPEHFYANISAGSWTPANLRAYIDTFGTFGARTAILVLNPGDVYDIPRYEPQSAATHPQERPLLALSEGIRRYLPRYLPHGMARWLLPPHIPNPYKRPADMEVGHIELRRILERFADEGIRACIILHATRFPEAKDIDPHMLAFREVARDMNVTVLETEEAFAATGRPEADFFRDLIHINADGLRVMAGMLQDCDVQARLPEKDTRHLGGLGDRAGQIEDRRVAQAGKPAVEGTSHTH